MSLVPVFENLYSEKFSPTGNQFQCLIKCSRRRAERFLRTVEERMLGQPTWLGRPHGFWKTFWGSWGRSRRRRYSQQSKEHRLQVFNYPIMLYVINKIGKMNGISYSIFFFFFSHPISPNVLDFQYYFGILERKSVGKEEGN